MKNIFTKDKIEKFSSLVRTSDRVAIVSHTNPDGDAIGSGIALALLIRDHFGIKNVRFIVPNRFPSFLAWANTENIVEIFSENCAENEAFLASADLIIIADFNDTRRLESMGVAMERNIHAPRVLIDHHIAPPNYDLNFHTTESSSTAFLVFSLIEALGGEISKTMADALYLAIMTDTGCFSHSNLSPDLFRAVARLVECGVDAAAVNRSVYNTQSESRVRMVGYLLSEKMVVDIAHNAAYITLTSAEKDRFHHQIGDTEGLVNIPLTISGVNFSAILIEAKDSIKVSLRSAEDLDVNILARQYFNGGGHKNAAGGKYFGSMSEALEQLEKLIQEL